ASVHHRDLHSFPTRRSSDLGYGSYDHVLDALEAALSGRTYIAGDNFTAADVYVGSQLAWGLGFGTIEDRPVFRDYAERMSARPRSEEHTSELQSRENLVCRL